MAEDETIKSRRKASGGRDQATINIPVHIGRALIADEFWRRVCISDLVRAYLHDSASKKSGHVGKKINFEQDILIKTVFDYMKKSGFEEPYSSDNDFIARYKEIVTAKPATADTPTPTEEVAYVEVSRETLKLAKEHTGIENPTELVEFALRLLTDTDPSAEFARQTRGSIPDLDLDI